MKAEYSEHWIGFDSMQLLWRIRHFIIYTSLHICYLQQSCGRRNAGRAGKACGAPSVCHTKRDEEFYPQYGKSAQPPKRESEGRKRRKKTYVQFVPNDLVHYENLIELFFIILNHYMPSQNKLYSLKVAEM